MSSCVTILPYTLFPSLHSAIYLNICKVSLYQSLFASSEHSEIVPSHLLIDIFAKIYEILTFQNEYRLLKQAKGSEKGHKRSPEKNRRGYNVLATYDYFPYNISLKKFTT